MQMGERVSKRTVKVIRVVRAMRKTIGDWRADGQTVALVPTMGALHEGHLALVRQARRRCRRTVVSIFVNPTQFAPGEDLDSYPRTFEDDLDKLDALGCDAVWAPGPGEMYPEGFATRIVLAGAAEGLESDFRPHFFGGVATVCCKLFTQVAPDIAVFGEKDYQQLQVVRQLVRDLDLPLRIVGIATIREADGLAMSSRNRYLSADERAIAPALHASLRTLAGHVAGAGAKLTARRIEALEQRAAADLLAAGFAKVDYVAVRDAQSLAPAALANGRPLRALAAAWLGKTRLIDNVGI